jgi:hypothetical protein
MKGRSPSICKLAFAPSICCGRKVTNCIPASCAPSTSRRSANNDKE